MQGNGGFISGSRKIYSLEDNGAIGVHNTFDQYNARIDNKWPKVKKLVSISPNTANHLEGEPKLLRLLWMVMRLMIKYTIQ